MTTLHPPPPHAGSDLARRVIVDCLDSASFTERAVCTRLGIPDYDVLDEVRTSLLTSCVGTDPLTLCARLFVLGGRVEPAALIGAIGTQAVEALRSTGLLAVDAGADGGAEAHAHSPVRLVPLEHRSLAGRTLYVASDRSDHADGSRFEPFPDIVFSAHNPLTRQFLRLLPAERAGSVLELCAGTGVGALVAAATAGSVTAVDITERCIEFARFNVWLNGDDRVELRRGDLYAPVVGERFDRIIAHPPYVPALSERLIYRDGGITGDRLLRQIVTDAPSHLEPGGTLHVLSIGMDTADAPFEHRVRGWLGARADEFDIVFAFGSAMSPADFARSLVTRSHGARPEDYDRWVALFAEHGVREVVYGATVIRRFEERGAPQTRRVVAGERTEPAAFARLLRWFDWVRAPGFDERVRASVPRLASCARVDVSHAVEGGRFVPTAFRLSMDDVPFKVHLNTDGWVVAVLNAFDGHTTIEEVRARARGAGALPEALSDQAFLDLMCLLVERGFLALEGVD